MQHRFIDYTVGDRVFQGRLSYDPAIQEKRPAILVAHTWRGRDAFACEKADQLARLGYVAFAADVYGGGHVATSDDEAASFMKPLFINRASLRKRITSAFDTLRAQPEVHRDLIGAIGFCFGGLTVIELLRSGAPIKGVVSFHGVLGNTVHAIQAQLEPLAPSIKGSLLILHGYEDPLVSQQDIVDIQKECNDAGIDWQMNTYGHAKHSFTNPQAKDPTTPFCYNEKAEKRSWRSMVQFFEEIFSQRS